MNIKLKPAVSGIDKLTLQTTRDADGWWRSAASIDGAQAGVIETGERTYTIDGEEFWPVYLVYVDAKFRNQGLARELYKELLKKATGAGLVSLPEYRGSTYIPDYLSRTFTVSKKSDGAILIRAKENLDFTYWGRDYGSY
jgi:GNAT superfamily N-acetyltransferase